MESRVGQLTQLVESARKQGARGTEALLEVSSGCRMQVARGKVADEAPLAEQRLRVRCWLEGGREGASVGTLEEADAVVQRALQAAAGAPEDPFAGPSSRLQAVLGGLGIDDRRHGSVSRADRLDVLAAAERSVRQTDRRIAASDFRCLDRRRQRTFVNSKGVALEETDTVYEAEGTVSATYDGDDVRIVGSIEARTFASIASIPYGTILARRLAALLQKGETLDGEVLVMMPPIAVARLFARLGEQFTYRSFAEGTFFLQPRPDDEPVVDSKIHLVDDGTLPGGFHTRSFDDRGTSPIPLTLLREGRPDGRFLDARTARELEVRPTGHLDGDRLRPTNLLLRSGTRSMNATFTDHDTWTFLLDDLDVSGLDLATGDLEAVVSGQVMKSNVPKGALRNVRLRGNLLTVLNQVHDVASDTDRHGHVDAPGMLVGGFTIG